jgi:hypothetical protein
METNQIAQLLTTGGLHAALVYDGSRVDCPYCKQPDVGLLSEAA